MTWAVDVELDRDSAVAVGIGKFLDVEPSLRHWAWRTYEAAGVTVGGDHLAGGVLHRRGGYHPRALWYWQAGDIDFAAATSGRGSSSSRDRAILTGIKATGLLLLRPPRIMDHLPHAGIHTSREENERIPRRPGSHGAPDVPPI